MMARLRGRASPWPNGVTVAQLREYQGRVRAMDEAGLADELERVGALDPALRHCLIGVVQERLMLLARVREVLT
jgi:hypothetical protein